MHNGYATRTPGRPSSVGSGSRTGAAFGHDKRSDALFLLICVSTALLLGIYRIGYYSLWLDEYSTLMATGSWENLNGYLSAFPEQHPLYYFLIKGLGVNHTLAQIRFFSLICGALALFPLYFLGRRAFSNVTASAACVCFAVSPFIQYFNQEGRMYTLIVLLALIQVAFLVKWTQDGPGAAKYGFAVFSILSLYTHFFASFLLAAQLIWYLAVRLKKGRTMIRTGEAIVIFAVIGLAYSPWLFRIFSNLGAMSQNWRGSYNLVFGIPYTFFRFGAGYGIFPLDYDVKRHLGAYLPAGLFWGGVFCLAYLPATILVIKRRKLVTADQGLAFAIAFLPIMLVVAASFIKNVASERYVIFSAPFFYLVTASALEPGTKSVRGRKAVAAGLPILLFIAGLGYYYFSPHFGKTNYKAASAYILAEDNRAARVICTPDAVAGPMQYYLKDRMTVTPYRLWTPSNADADVWLVERMADMPAPLSLGGKRFVEISHKIFPQENGLRVTRWRLFSAQ